MIKRTIYLGRPCYVRRWQGQMVIEYDDESLDNKQVPIEDIGMLIADHYQVKLTAALIQSLIEVNAAVLFTDQRHLPAGLLLPFAAHHTYTEKLRYQLEASQPLRKNLWQQTVVAKIRNQARLLRLLGLDADKMDFWAGKVRSGDPENLEGRAASWYWEVLFGQGSGFRRHRFGDPPNNLFNYGYAILRATVARSLVASGMLPAVGIHHRNKYNPFCLADDIMEPFRPFVDRIVLNMTEQYEDTDELTKEMKRDLLQIPAIDITVEGEKCPMMVGLSRTTASLMRCFEGSARKIIYPELA